MEKVIMYALGGWKHIGVILLVAISFYIVSKMIFIFSNTSKLNSIGFFEDRKAGLPEIIIMVTSTLAIMCVAIGVVAGAGQLRKDFDSTNKEMKRAAVKTVEGIGINDLARDIRLIEEETGIKDLASYPISSAERFN